MASTPSSHKPRRKRKLKDFPSASHGGSVVTSEGGIQQPAFPLVAFLWAAKGTVSQWIVLPCILMAVGLFRWATGFWGYSGMYIV